MAVSTLFSVVGPYSQALITHAKASNKEEVTRPIVIQENRGWGKTLISVYTRREDRGLIARAPIDWIIMPETSCWGRISWCDPRESLATCRFLSPQSPPRRAPPLIYEPYISVTIHIGATFPRRSRDVPKTPPPSPDTDTSESRAFSQAAPSPLRGRAADVLTVVGSSGVGWVCVCACVRVYVCVGGRKGVYCRFLILAGTAALFGGRLLFF
jgi:hypothetical protein